MIINFMKNSALDTLTADIPKNVSRYNSDDRWIDAYFEEKGMANYSFSTGIMVPDVDLIIGNSSTDFENSKRIYEAFKDSLNPVQASDLRLWAYLAHFTYWEYMHKRWAINVASEDDDDDTESNKLIARIGSRYFFKASKGKAFVRQGIARLYWAAYLTYNESNSENPYEMTEYFLSKQDIFAVSTEHALARNKALLIGTLKALKEHGDLKRPEIRKFIVKLNQAGGIVVFDSLTIDSAYSLAQDVLSEVLAEDSDSAPDNKAEFEDGDFVQANDSDVAVVQSLTDAEPKQTVKASSRIVAENVKTGAKMPIAIKNNKFQTKPNLIGLKKGDTFKIRKNVWKVLKIE